MHKRQSTPADSTGPTTDMLDELRQIKTLLALQLLGDGVGKQQGIASLHKAGLSNLAIADIVGTSADAVRARLSEAKKKRKKNGGSR